MPSRLRNYPVGSFVHLFNRGVEKRQVYNDDKDYIRFLQSLDFYAKGYQNFSTHIDNLRRGDNAYTTLKVVLEKKPLQKIKPLVRILVLCLMPNHFHMLVQQICGQGIALFMQRLLDSYTKYFNTKYERVGSLFQGTYKSVLVKTDEQLLHLSRYIHLNPSELAPLVKSKSQQEATFPFIRNYPWSSYPDYIGTRNNGLNKLIDKNIILDFFQGNKWAQRRSAFLGDDFSYQAFVESYLRVSAVGVEDLILE